MDRTFLKGIHIVENFVSKVLAIALVLVIIVSIYDLIVILAYDLFSGTAGFFERTLIEIFGLFLNVLIALELLENITAYLKKHILQVELVVVTALIAVARKIIIFDLQKLDGSDLLALAIAILSLSFSYWLVKTVNKRR
ncbi:MAG: hypothetical protein HC810_01960 [Acaryochloridaceae cyanobacterium RL_2_7]|nr:hypothetical protein [Acaryochloridaceae cyanobacterium RL_2_7]